MNHIYINNKKTVLSSNFDHNLLKDVLWSPENFNNHGEIIKEIKNKNPYVVSIFIERLKWELRHKKKYVKLTKIPIQTLYHELLFKKLYEEYGEDEVNEVYRSWLDKYDRNDDLIFKKEIEPKYKDEILLKNKNHTKLFKNRCEYKRERYYNLPEPLNWVDWRTLFDNLFIWQDGNKKYAHRGGGGSSQARETNSKFMYALLALNKFNPIPSYLMIYTENNKLTLAKRFGSLTVPDYDIGSNYSVDRKLDSDLKKNGRFMTWKDIFNPNRLIIKS
ncbi:MAG: hypothetical protein QY322_04095 [bacterium]|nr:MAG: hypothetical protein QY322_04095 [bacterium]